MSTLIFQGSPRHVASGLAILASSTFDVLVRRLRGRPLCKAWPVEFEIGTLFYRRQFERALAYADIREGRAYFDAVTLAIRGRWPVRVEAVARDAAAPGGHWFRPHAKCAPGGPVVLYLHGGGYAFYADVSHRFVAMLAFRLGLPVFALDYRLTPEHPHPAQLEDALAAYRRLLAEGVAPERIVVAGDSAGGHLALMLIVALRDAELPQPSLVVALSPWTDTGRRGASQFGHDVFDMVQGRQTVLYSSWLKGDTDATDRELSPIYRDFRGLAPVYLQAGGKEILVDMVRDFAAELRRQGASVHLDVWPHMTHEFHAYGDRLPDSDQALARISAAIAWAHSRESMPFSAIMQSEVAAFHPRPAAVGSCSAMALTRDNGRAPPQACLQQNA
ncbi:alpha/beta hydrolase [Lysobacter korlensis]|uniref:Alpha/beta hydrolase n=1 Tax=Lysobacter korlensis TaxID=553636 RepID=A0ABV6RV38_9GAMM